MRFAQLPRRVLSPAKLACTLMLAMVSIPVMAQSVVGEMLAERLQSRGPAADLQPASAHLGASAPMHQFRASQPENSAALRALAAHNRARVPPLQNGFKRALPGTLRLRLPAQKARDSANGGTSLSQEQTGMMATLADGTRVWTGTVAVERAWRLRMLMGVLNLPAEALMWVEDASGNRSRPFGTELADSNGQLWTPSVAGPTIRIRIQLPAGSDGLDITFQAVSELFQLDAAGQPVTAASATPADGCIEDAQCFSSTTFSAIDEVRKAIARIMFQVGNSSYLCTAGLLNDTDTSTAIPYLLTANHCFESEQSAASLEAWWDYTSAICNGASPSLASLPRSNGATLLASDPVGDYTLVQLNGIPSGRWLLGWSNEPIADGTVLNRISHPQGGKQSFSQSTFSNALPSCEGLSRADFLYSAPTLGGTLGGSSGSPIMLDSGQVVGQLYGACGPNPSDACDPENADVDGAMASFFSAVSQWLDPGPGCVYELTQPDGGESWEQASSELITWTATGTGCADTVRIHLYRADNQELVIRGATANDGKYRWNIPADLAAGSNFRVRVIDTDNPEFWGQSTSDFTITAAPPPDPTVFKNGFEQN